MTPDQKDYIRQNAASLDPQTMAMHLGIRYYAVWEFCTRHGLPKIKSQVPKVRKVKVEKAKECEAYKTLIKQQRGTIAAKYDEDERPIYDGIMIGCPPLAAFFSPKIGSSKPVNY